MIEKKKVIEIYTVKEIIKALKLHPYTVHQLCGKIGNFSTSSLLASRKLGE